MTEKEYLIQLSKAAYFEYKVISRPEYVVIYETAINVYPKKQLFKIIKKFAENIILETDDNFSLIKNHNKTRNRAGIKKRI